MLENNIEAILSYLKQDGKKAARSERFAYVSVSYERLHRGIIHQRRG
jgi:hypothetical protein